MEISLDDISFDSQSRKKYDSDVDHRNNDNNIPQIVQRVISDIKENLDKKGSSPHNTLFYKIVQGGNLHVTQQALQMLKQHDLDKERAWLFGNGNPQERHSHIEVKERCIFTSCCKRLSAFAVLAVLYVVMTPVFYICHAAISYVRRFFIQSTCDNISHPVYLVCRSKSIEMIKLFKDEGLKIYQVDEDRNTVMHHLVHHSMNDTEGAREMWNNLLKVYKQADVSLLCSLTNRLGLDALEYCALVGSVEFLCHMMNSHKTFKSVELWVDPNTVCVRDCMDENTNCKETTQGKTLNGLIQARYNVTKYELGNLSNRSSLLNLVCHGGAQGKISDGTVVTDKKSLLGTWIRKKNNMFTLARILSNLDGILISVLIVTYIIVVGGSINTIPLGQMNLQLYIDIVEKAAPQVLNASDIQQSSLHEIFSFCWQEDAYFGTINITSWCQLEAFEVLSDKCGRKFSELELLQETGMVPKYDERSYTWLLIIILAIEMSSYMLYDIVMRLAYLWSHIMHPMCDLQDTLNRIIFFKIPGSYTAKQLNVLSYSLYSASSLVYYVFEKEVLPPISNAYFDQSVLVQTWLSNYSLFFYYLSIMSLLTTLSLILRMISFVFTLRLIPKLGHFIILTFKMTATLLSFLVVYFVILIAFSLLFHFLLYDPQCPSLHVENFETVTDSCYQTFLFMLGMANFPENHSSVARGTYIFYLLISAIVLLNLIIAIMSSIVEELNEQPNKAATHLMLHLEDALAAEMWLGIITWPCWPRLHTWMLRRGGLVVTDNTDRKSSCCGTNTSVCITISERT